MSHYEDIRDELRQQGITLFSNSGITAANECSRRYDYQYGRKLMAADPSSRENMYRGVVGHAALAEYYEAKKNGFDESFARKAAYSVVIDQITKNPHHALLLMKLRELIETYFEFYEVRDTFKVISVETVYTTPVTPTDHFGAILDLIIQYTEGPLKDRMAVVDHKFVYNFLNPDVLELDPQIPKYILVAKANGFPVSMGIYNQLRHREMKSPNYPDMFQRLQDRSGPKARQGMWEEQEKTIAKINKNEPTIATLSHMVCKGCDFRTLCKAELNGEPTATLLKTAYQTRISREG